MGKLNDIKRELKDLHALKEYANNVSRLQKEIERLNGDIKFLESELMSTGSTKTADDVQAEIDAISADMYVRSRLAIVVVFPKQFFPSLQPHQR